MRVCPSCKKPGLNSIAVVFMIHDERVICRACGVALTIPKSRKSLLIGIEYVLLLAAVALSIHLRTLLPAGLLLLLLALNRSIILPKMAVEQRRTLNRLKKYRRKR